MRANIITVRCSLIAYVLCAIFRLCTVSIFRLCHVSIFSLCSVSILSPCYVRFLVCVLCVVFRRVGPVLRCVWLASLGSGRFAAAVAASRLQAISPNITVFVVLGLTFMDVSALAHTRELHFGSPPSCLPRGHFPLGLRFGDVYQFEASVA